MDLRVLHDVKNINDYISATHDAIDKVQDALLPFNMSTILSLKKNRSFELEYFIKYHEHGIVFAILRRMIQLPPSKTWGLLGKELVALLQYWLDGLRKYLITHSPHWWNFLKTLLLFINEIRLKDHNINGILVKEVAESLFDVACTERLNIDQREEVVRCLNLFCARANRDIRAAFQAQFAAFFPKLSYIMGTTDHVPSQLSILELLLRWLPNRKSVDVRQDAAAAWFPLTLYHEEAIKTFLERSFCNFYKDARDFLNAHNSRRGFITTVVCRKFTIGNVSVISNSDKSVSYVDISAKHGISVVLEPRLLLELGLSRESHEVISITVESVDAASLYRESTEVVISLKLSGKPQAKHPETEKIFKDSWNTVKICISSKSDMKVVDKAMKDTFGSKYVFKLTESNRNEIFSPENTNKFPYSDDDSRFSQPYDPPKKGKSGFVVNPHHKGPGWKSPSTTSTTSLAQLHDRLAALPRFRYDREPAGVCALPDLSCVTEISEPDEDNVSIPNKPRRVGQSKRRKNLKTNSISDGEDISKYLTKRRVSPRLNINAKSPCLLSATIGSYEESVINDTFEQKDKDISFLAADDFGDIAQVEAGMKDVIVDSGINTCDNVKKTPTNIADMVNASSNDKDQCAVNNKTISEEQSVVANKESTKATSEESNTEAINETPFIYENTKVTNTTRKLRSKKTTVYNCETEVRNFKNIGQDDKGTKKHQPAFNIDEIEEFFSQHFKENEQGEFVISPSLARKVNVSSSECSDSFDKYFVSNVDQHMSKIEEETMEYVVDKDDIIRCLADMIDQVCSSLGKPTVSVQREEVNKLDDHIIENSEEVNNAHKDIIQEITVAAKKKATINQKRTNKTAKIKLTYNKVTPTRNTKRNMPKKLDLDSTVVADVVPLNVIDNKVDNKDSGQENNKKSKASTDEKQTDSDTPLIPRRKKRKLYSPDDVDIESGIQIPETEDDTTNDRQMLKHTPKTTATPYRDIEKDRKMQTRNRKSNTKAVLSPRTLKQNELFDKLKNTIDGETDLKIVDKKSSERTIAMYNYTSESEDEDFKSKMIDRKMVQKRKNKNQRQIKGKKKKTDSKTSSTDDDIKELVEKPKRPKRLPKHRLLDQPIDLEDVRMRKAPKEQSPLNKSMIIEPVEDAKENIEPNLNFVSKMEPIPEVSLEEDLTEPNITIPVHNNAKTKPKKVKKIQKNDPKPSENYTRESPLPPLIIESCAPQKNKTDGSTSSSNLLEKCNKIIQNGYPTDNTTQNLLDDIDNVNYSPELQDIPLELEICQNLEKTEDPITAEIIKEPHVPPTRSKSSEVIELKTLKTNTRQTRSKTKKQTSKAKRVRSKEIIKVKMEYPKLKNKYNLNRSKVITDSEIEEVLTIPSSVCDQVSEKSIDTVGRSPINAHGTFDEEPPSPEMISKSVSHRNLEMQDMSKSIKQYFYNLRSQTEKSGNKSSNSPETVIRDKDTSVVTSPASTSKHLSEVEVKKSMPKSPQHTVDITKLIVDNKICLKSIDIRSISSPTVSLTRLSDEELRKWLPSPRSSTTNDTHITAIDTSTKQKKPAQKKAVEKLPPKKAPKKRNKKVDSRVKPQMTLRKSLISPIDIQLDDPIRSPSPVIDESSTVKHDSQKSKAMRYDFRHIEKYPSPSRSIKSNSDATLKRLATPESIVTKKRRVETNADMVKEKSLSPSIKSVEDWFSRNLPRSNTDESRQTYKDCMQNVLEKLDTTLVEIHSNTSKKFVHMFVDLQEQQQKMKEERQKAFTNTVKDIMRGFMQVVEEKFTEFEESCDRQDAEYTAEMKRRAVEVVRDDSRQKRALVSLLRDDVQAAFNTTNKRNTF